MHSIQTRQIPWTISYIGKTCVSKLANYYGTFSETKNILYVSGFIESYFLAKMSMINCVPYVTFWNITCALYLEVRKNVVKRLCTIVTRMPGKVGLLNKKNWLDKFNQHCPVVLQLIINVTYTYGECQTSCTINDKYTVRIQAYVDNVRVSILWGKCVTIQCWSYRCIYKIQFNGFFYV